MRAGQFSGKVQAELRADEFRSFRLQLERLQADSKSKASLHSMDYWLEVAISGDSKGQFKAECWVSDEPGIGNQLSFELEFDQTTLSAIIESLRLIEKTFPIVGEKDG